MATPCPVKAMGLYFGPPQLIIGHFKHEVRWNTVNITAEGSFEVLGIYAIRFNQVTAEHDLEVMDQKIMSIKFSPGMGSAIYNNLN